MFISNIIPYTYLYCYSQTLATFFVNLVLILRFTLRCSINRVLNRNVRLVEIHAGNSAVHLALSIAIKPDIPVYSSHIRSHLGNFVHPFRGRCYTSSAYRVAQK